MDSGNVLNIGDLILVRGHLYSLLDDSVKLHEWIHNKRPLWDCYSHIGIFMGNGAIAEAQGGRTSGYALLSEYEGNYDIGHVDLTDKQRDLVRNAAIEQFSLPYDWFLILDYAVDDLTGIHVPYHERARRICSTYVDKVFKQAIGLDLTGLAYPTPEDIALCKYVTIEKVNE